MYWVLICAIFVFLFLLIYLLPLLEYLTVFILDHPRYSKVTSSEKEQKHIQTKTSDLRALRDIAASKVGDLMFMLRDVILCCVCVSTRYPSINTLSTLKLIEKIDFLDSLGFQDIFLLLSHRFR